MPLMQPEKKISNDQLTVTLPAEALNDLRAYARYLNNSSVGYVLTQLIGTLTRDKEFLQWKTGSHRESPVLPLPSLANGTGETTPFTGSGATRPLSIRHNGTSPSSASHEVTGQGLTTQMAATSEPLAAAKEKV